MHRNQMKGYNDPKDLNELQAKIEERASHREKLFSDNPEKMVSFYA